MCYFSTKESINKVVNEVRMAVRTRLYMVNISTRNNNYTRMTRWDPYCADDLKLPARRNIKIFKNENKTTRCMHSKKDWRWYQSNLEPGIKLLSPVLTLTNLKILVYKTKEIMSPIIQQSVM